MESEPAGGPAKARDVVPTTEPVAAAASVLASSTVTNAF